MNKKIIKIGKTKGQSLVEFVLIFPVFLLFSLGLIQLSLIIVNTFLVKYTAYITARVAIAYNLKSESEEKANKANNIMIGMMNLINSKYILSKEFYTDFNNLKWTFFKIIRNLTEKSKVDIEIVSIKNSKDNFIKVTVKYLMPLKIPFVNKIFSLFSLEKENYKNFFYYLLSKEIPFYKIKSTVILRAPEYEE